MLPNIYELFGIGKFGNLGYRNLEPRRYCVSHACPVALDEFRFSDVVAVIEHTTNPSSVNLGLRLVFCVQQRG